MLSNLGSQGKLSQVLNGTFTPISHKLLPNDEEFLTIGELNQTYFDIGGFTAKKFGSLVHPLNIQDRQICTMQGIKH